MNTENRRSGRSKTANRLSRRVVLLTGALLVGAGGIWFAVGEAAPPARAETVVVTMSPWCDCCGVWVDYMRQAGFDVEEVETDDIGTIKREAHLPDELYSCHTAKIGGYVVEGHVPLPAIDKLLAERPAIDGIALAGMPPGSPGMGGQPRPSYPVEAFRDGRLDGRFMDAPLR